jgi:hypothetical protein
VTIAKAKATGGEVFGGLVGKPFVTVGNSGSGATFMSADQTAFNSAVSSLATSGGEVFVLPGTTIVPTAELVLTGTMVNVHFGKGAKIANANTFLSRIVANGQVTWTNIFVVGTAVDCNVYDLYITNSVTTNASVSGIVCGGGNVNVCFYNPVCTGLTRWARSLTGYVQTSGGTIYDGGNDGVTFYNPRSDSCGSGGIPDGGGIKFFNGCTTGVGVGTNKNVTEYNPRDTNVHFTSWDSNPQNNNNGNFHQGLERYGGYFTFANNALGGANGTGACFGVFVEAAYAAATQGARFFGGEYHMLGTGTGAGNIGLIVGAANRSANFIGCEVFDADIGWEVIGLTGQALQGGPFVFDGVKSYRCVRGGDVNPNAANGTLIAGLKVRGCVADDLGSGVMTTGWRFVSGGAQRAVWDMEFSDNDASRIATGGTVVTLPTAFVGFPRANIRNIKGLTDQGLISTPATTAVIAEFRKIGGTTATAVQNVAYRANYLDSVLTATGGSGVSMTFTHMDGTTLQSITTNAGTTGVALPSVWYQVQGTAASVTVVNGTWPTTGSGQGIFAIGVDGTVLINGATQVTAVSLPINSLVNFGAFTGGPTITITGVATPFLTLSAIATPVASMRLPPGCTVNFGAFGGGGNAPNVTYTVDGAAVTSPFIRFREMSLAGTTGASGLSNTTTSIYEVMATPMKIVMAGGAGIALTDPANNTIVGSLTDVQETDLDPNFRWTSTTAPTTFAAYVRNN